MTKCEKYYSCDKSTNGDNIGKSCEDLGIWDDVDKQKAKCLKLRKKWEEYRESLSDWKELEKDDKMRKM